MAVGCVRFRGYVGVAIGALVAHGVQEFFLMYPASAWKKAVAVVSA